MKPYEIRIGNRVLEYDPKAGLTRLVERLPLEQPKVWAKDEAGSWHYRGLEASAQRKPEPGN